MKNLFQELPEPERIQALKDNCTEIEENYRTKRFFSKEELDDLKTEVSDESILVSELEDKLKEISAPIKADIKSKKIDLRATLKLVKQKYEENLEDVYLFADHHEGFMLYYNSKGELISSRKLLPHERQTKIVDLNQKIA